jgi:hypothetical protein
VEALRSLVESLKLTAYDVLAVLLPGAVCVRGLGLLLDGTAAGKALLGLEGLQLFTLAFTSGLVLQGAGGLLLRGRPQPELLLLARELIERRYGAQVPERLVLDFCLSKVEGKRGVYDKFVALRGMARGLSVAALVLGAAGVFASASAAGMAFAAVLGLLCAGSLYSLHRHYAPLGERAVVGLFFAAELQPLAPGAQAGKAPTKE